MSAMQKNYSPLVIAHEARAVAMAALKHRLGLLTSHRVKRVKELRGRGLLLPAFATKTDWAVYVLLRAALTRAGFTIITVPDEHELHQVSFFESLDRLNCLWVEENPDFVIGVSLGGLFGILLSLENKRPAVVIGSPIFGTPYVPLEWIVAQFIDLRADRRLVRMWQDLMCGGADRILTISGAHDEIAPPARCAIPGAQNEIVAGRHMDLILRQQTTTHVVDFLERFAKPQGRRPSLAA